ncbi:hypothetical protein H0H92_013375, partial [Tricholoma furcatifolium]
MTFVAPGEEEFDAPPPAAESSRWPQGFWRQEAVVGTSGSQGMQARGVVGSAEAYPANPFAHSALKRAMLSLMPRLPSTFFSITLEVGVDCDEQ